MVLIQHYYGPSGWCPGKYHDWDRMPDGERFLPRPQAWEGRARHCSARDTRPPSPEMTGFEYLEYFSREPRFPSIMAGYRLLRELDTLPRL